MNTCPNCQHDLVNIIYGIPTQELVDMAKTEDVALGGKKASVLDPKLYCYGCHETF